MGVGRGPAAACFVVWGCFIAWPPLFARERPREGGRGRRAWLFGHAAGRVHCVVSLQTRQPAGRPAVFFFFIAVYPPAPREDAQQGIQPGARGAVRGGTKQGRARLQRGEGERGGAVAFSAAASRQRARQRETKDEGRSGERERVRSLPARCCPLLPGALSLGSLRGARSERRGWEEEGGTRMGGTWMRMRGGVSVLCFVVCCGGRGSARAAWL